MKKDLLMIMVAIGFGFLLCLLLVKQKQEDKIVAVSDPATYYKVKRFMRDMKFPEFPQTVTPIIDNDTMPPITIDGTTPLADLPFTRFTADDSIPVYFNGQKVMVTLGVVFGFRGVGEYYEIETKRNNFSITLAESKRTTSLFLYGGPAFNQSLKFSHLEAGIFGSFKSFGLHGRYELYPIEQEKQSNRFLFSVVYRINIL